MQVGRATAALRACGRRVESFNMLLALTVVAVSGVSTNGGWGAFEWENGYYCTSKL